MRSYSWNGVSRLRILSEIDFTCFIAKILIAAIILWDNILIVIHSINNKPVRLHDARIQKNIGIYGK
jgi:hypothetical protein